MLGHAIRRDRRTGTRAACGGQRERIGMAGVRRDRGSQRERVGIDRTAVDQPRLAERERAGLVEDDGVHFGEAFERAAILDHDALLEQTSRGNDLHHGNGEAERAGTRDDQDRDGDGERPVDVSGCAIQPMNVATAVRWTTGA